MSEFLTILNLLVLGLIVGFGTWWLVRLIRNRRVLWLAADLRSADFYRSQGNYARALQFYDRVAQAKPELGQVHFGRAVSLLELGRYPEARTAAETAFERLVDVDAALDPADRNTLHDALPQGALESHNAVRADAQFIRGIAAFRQGDYPAAAEAYRHCLALRPGHPFANLALAEAELMAGNLQEAAVIGQVRGFAADDAGTAASLQFIWLVAERLQERDTTEAEEVLLRSLQRSGYHNAWTGLYAATWARLHERYPQHVRAVQEWEYLMRNGLPATEDGPKPMPAGRLVLVPLTADWAESYQRNREELAARSGLVLHPDFPVFPGSMRYWTNALRNDPALTGWANWLWVHAPSNTVVGDGGFKGKANAEGEVEIGYALVPEWQGQGLASEGVAALVQWAFAHPWVTAVLAETLPDGLASQRVLQKNGFVPDGEGNDGPRFRRPRPQA